MVNKERHSGGSIGCAKEEEESGHCMIGILIKTPEGSQPQATMGR
jgi:hypothetical protein